MPVYRRTIAAAAAGLAAAGVVVAAVVSTSGSSPQRIAATGDVSHAPALARPSGDPGAFLAGLRSVRRIDSTVPGDGDVNPYGVAVLTHTSGLLHAGNILVSNYNDKANLQGTGSTIVQITPSGHRRVFAQITKSMLSGSCPGGVGLSTALAVLPGNWVVVGNAPSSNGQVATAKPGCLIVLDSEGHVQETLSGSGIDGPWDATAVSEGNTSYLFVTNAFVGTAAGKDKVVRKGTVVRIVLRASASGPKLVSATTIATHLAEQGSSAAFVLGPTGVGLGADDILYIADTVTSAITAIPDAMFRTGSAGSGLAVTSGKAVNQPLGMAIAPDGDILTVNGGDGKIVETTPAGHQIATEYLDTSGSPAGAGALFGLAVARSGDVYFVDDVANTLNILR